MDPTTRQRTHPVLALLLLGGVRLRAGRRPSVANPPCIHVQDEGVRRGGHDAEADDEGHDQPLLLQHLVGVAEELRLQSGEGRSC